MLDPDVSDGPWISGHKRLLHKNCKNDTAALWDKPAATKKINYMNYKMSKKWVLKQEEAVEDTNGHFSSNRGHLWPAPAAQACCSFKQELQFDHEE